MHPSQPSPSKVPEVKQMDLFEKQDIPYTPPPIVKKDKIVLESDEITNSHWLHCSYCNHVEVYSSPSFDNDVIRFHCEQCHCYSFLEHVNTTKYDNPGMFGDVL